MASNAGKIEKYRKLLIKLLPKGRLWRVRLGSVFSNFLKATAQEFCRVDDRRDQMILEIDPRITDESLDQWERFLFIPDECTPSGQTPDERRTQIVQKLTNIGGISAEFYIFIIDQLGFTATIDHRINFVVGRATVGQALTNYFNKDFRVGRNKVGERLTDVGWRFYFNVNLPATAVTEFKVGINTVGQPLVFFTNPLIECTIRKLKPAHTGVTFTFV